MNEEKLLEYLAQRIEDLCCWYYQSPSWWFWGGSESKGAFSRLDEACLILELIGFPQEDSTGKLMTIDSMIRRLRLWRERGPYFGYKTGRIADRLELLFRRCNIDWENWRLVYTIGGRKY